MIGESNLTISCTWSDNMREAKMCQSHDLLFHSVCITKWLSAPFWGVASDSATEESYVPPWVFPPRIPMSWTVWPSLEYRGNPSAASADCWTTRAPAWLSMWSTTSWILCWKRLPQAGGVGFLFLTGRGFLCEGYSETFTMCLDDG